MKRLIADGRPWIIKFHCANHKIELAVKDILKDSAFSEVDKQYLAIFNLMKNVGAVKSDMKSAAKALDTSCYTLPKITGTRFGSHRKKAYTHLLNMWPALITVFQNTLAYCKIKAETKAKISGLLKVLQNYEKDHLLVTEVKPSLSTTYLKTSLILPEMMTNFLIAIWLNIDMKKKMAKFL